MVDRRVDSGLSMRAFLILGFLCVWSGQLIEWTVHNHIRAPLELDYWTLHKPYPARAFFLWTARVGTEFWAVRCLWPLRFSCPFSELIYFMSFIVKSLCHCLDETPGPTENVWECSHMLLFQFHIIKKSYIHFITLYMMLHDYHTYLEHTATFISPTNIHTYIFHIHTHSHN